MRIACIEKFPLQLLLLTSGLMAGAVSAVASDAVNAAEPFAASSQLPTMAASSAARRLRLDFSALTQVASASVTPYALSGTPSIKLRLPLPEGGDTEFTLTDSGVMPPQLARRFPHIRSMQGVDADGRQVRLDLSEAGVYAWVSGPDGSWQIQPAFKGKAAINDMYISSRSGVADLSLRDESNSIQTAELAASMPFAGLHGVQPGNSGRQDNSHRDYRIAIATTSGYSKHLGGTVSASLASVVQVVNRVNAIFERDLGIHLTLVKDNDKLIFIDPAKDPYIPPNADDLSFTREQNIKVLNQIIGQDNYDVGHIFEAGDQGGATNGSVCDPDKKADAGSGLDAGPDKGPRFDEHFIMTVAHELGHQFGADHVANGCERDSKRANEPGSGSTVMSYAGGCFLMPTDFSFDTHASIMTNRLHELQDHRDAYFNAINIAQVRAFIGKAGAACGVPRQNPRTAPVIVRPQRDTAWFIPAHTPFFLDGRAVSRHHQARLTYTWEQMDAGAEQMTSEVLSDKGNGPIFRSFPPRADGRRVFPALAAVLGEQPISNGEVYPATNRELNFRLTVRDNLGRQSSTSQRDTNVQVIDTGKPFRITYPDQRSTWRARDKQLVSWDVAGTDHAPISCRRVRIDLSLDGGHTYPVYPLMASAPNNGWAIVSLPRLRQDVSVARIRVACNGNVFFAVSPGNFTIRR